MLKLIMKNLWSRRRRNGWLLAELILVTVVSWAILDPVVVTTYDRSLPFGYDADRLCVVSLAVLPPDAAGYVPEPQDSATRVNNFFNLVRHVENHPSVEMASPLLGNMYLNSTGMNMAEYFTEDEPVERNVLIIDFMPGTRFFETYGMKPGQGCTAERLSSYSYGKNDVVLPENTARVLFAPGTNALGHVLYRPFWQGDTIRHTVAATVADVKAFSDSYPVPLLFRPILSFTGAAIPNATQVLVRLKDGVNMERFLHEFRPWMAKELHHGNLYANNVTSYRDVISLRESYTSTPVYHRNLSMAIFFLVNLCLGVAGTFWLQTRTRREEVGVLLSFGGTSGYISRLLMGEGFVLTLVATVVGCLIYLPYALLEGLDEGVVHIQNYADYWVTNFALHYFIVSAVVFLLLLVVVLAGIYIPARNISRISPTDALRDE